MEALHFLRAIAQFLFISLMLSVSIRLYIHFSVKTSLYKSWHDRRVKSMQSALDAEHRKNLTVF